MTLQFVGAGETLTTEEPIADKRTLARVPAKMRFEMRCFTINLENKLAVSNRGKKIQNRCLCDHLTFPHPMT
jgi:hypothetical protein